MTISLRTYFVIQVKRRMYRVAWRMYRVCFRKHLSRYIPKIYLSPLLLQLLIFLYTYTACTCRVYFIKHLSCYLYIWHVQNPCKIIFVLTSTDINIHFDKHTYSWNSLLGICTWHQMLFWPPGISWHNQVSNLIAITELLTDKWFAMTFLYQ